MTRHYDNERLGKHLIRKHRYVEHRRRAQGYRFSDQEIAARRAEIKEGKFKRLDELNFRTADDDEGL